MREKILAALEDGVSAIAQLQQAQNVRFIEQVAEAIATTYRQEGKILVAGNGGSLCDAMHFAEELTGQFRSKRAALGAIALSDPSHMSCVANDMGFDEVFARGVEALGRKGDIFVGLTTSGNSPNIIRAFEVAAQREMTTVAFLGKGGGRLKGVADYELGIEGFVTSDRIQEAHMTAIHIIIEMVEAHLFHGTLVEA